MNSLSDSSNGFDASELVAFLYAWKKPLIIVSVVAAVLSAIFSAPYFIKPKYESKVILFPGSTSSISKAGLNESAGIKNDILQFGEEDQADQLLQILNSDDIKFRIISKYDLMSHYDIDPNGSYPKTKLNKEYDDNISYRRTEFLAIEIRVLDTDPDTAAMIANDISNLLDTAKNRMQKEIAVKAFEIVKKEFNALTAYIGTIRDSLKTLGMLGVHDYKSQSEVLNRQYAEVLAKNDQRAIKILEDKLAILAKYGSTQMSLAYSLENIYEEVFPVIKRKYDEARVDATETLPHKFVVNRAYPAEKKSYPIRWLIVVMSTLAAFLMASVVIIVKDNLDRITNHS